MKLTISAKKLDIKFPSWCQILLSSAILAVKDENTINLNANPEKQQPKEHKTGNSLHTIILCKQSSNSITCEANLYL